MGPQQSAIGGNEIEGELTMAISEAHTERRAVNLDEMQIVRILHGKNQQVRIWDPNEALI